MASKTFKIGEYMKGGVCTVEIEKGKIAVIAKDWDFKAGSNKNSDQSNAKEFDRIEVLVDDFAAHQKISEFLDDLMSYYYCEQIINYIKEHVTFIMA